MRGIGITFLFLTTFIFASSIPKVDIKTNSFQKIIKKDKNGKKIEKWVKVTKVVPGNIIKYVDTIKNESNITIENISVKHKIDKHLIFINNSIKSKEKIDTLFSLDGKNFFKAKDLYIEKNGKKYLATPKDYRAIKFNIKKLNPNSKTEIEYKVKIK